MGVANMWVCGYVGTDATGHRRRRYILMTSRNLTYLTVPVLLYLLHAKTCSSPWCYQAASFISRTLHSSSVYLHVLGDTSLIIITSD